MEVPPPRGPFGRWGHNHAIARAAKLRAQTGAPDTGKWQRHNKTRPKLSRGGGGPG